MNIELNGTEEERGKQFFLQAFRSKRFANEIQEEAVARLIITHGYEIFKAGVEWAAILGMSRGRAILSLQKALPKWNRPRCTTQPVGNKYLTEDSLAQWAERNR
jgi:hypothetical protein